MQICSVASVARKVGVSKPTMLFYLKRGVVVADFVEDDRQEPRHFWLVGSVGRVREQLLTVCLPEVAERIRDKAAAGTSAYQGEQLVDH